MRRRQRATTCCESRASRSRVRLGNTRAPRAPTSLSGIPAPGLRIGGRFGGAVAGYAPLRPARGAWAPAGPRPGPSASRKRPHFSNFGPPAAPTLATLLAAWIEDLFAEAPVGAGWRLRRTLAHRGPRRPTLAGLVPICTRYTLADLTPKYPTLATSTHGCYAPALNLKCTQQIVPLARYRTPSPRRFANRA